MDFLEPPGSARAPARPPQEQALAIYGGRGDWAERVNVEAVLAREPAESPTASARVRWALSAAAIVAALALLLARDWKIKAIFFPARPERELVTTLEVPALAERDFPDGLRAAFSEINALVRAQDWQHAVEKAEMVRTAPALRQKPGAYAWLHDLIAVLATKMGGNQRTERAAYRHVKAVAEAYDRSVRAPSFALLYSYALALFELDGGSNDGAIQMKGEAAEAPLLRAIAELRNTHGRKIAGDRELARKLLRIEGFSLARALEPNAGGLFAEPFDAKKAGNAACWNRLDEVLREWAPLEGASPNVDFQNLRRWFWQQVRAFCRWRHGFRSEVQIGRRIYTKDEAKRQTEAR